MLIKYASNQNLLEIEILRSGNFAAKPGFQRPAGATPRSHLEPVPLTEKGLLPEDYVLEDPDSHFIYVCKKLDVTTDLSHKSANSLADDTMQR